jgi:hypothetical protein
MHPNRLIRSLGLLLLVAAGSTLLGGCLTVQQKEYIFTLKPDGKGTGRIIFHDIRSMEEEGDNSVADYTKLVNDYIKGKEFDESNPLYSNIKKRLFEDKGRLMGEITFDFETPEDVGLFRYQGKGPWMYYTEAMNNLSSERYESSNGTLGGEKMPVLFWEEKTREFRVINSFDNKSRPTSSLLPLYRRIGVE